MSGGSTVSVPKLANIDAATITVSGGVLLSLPLVQSYTGITTAYAQQSAADRTTSLRATGTGSVLDLPGLTNIDIGTANVVTIEIDAQSGGRINLQSVTQISDTTEGIQRRMFVTADGVGSVINLSSLTNFVDNSFGSPDWHSKLAALNGGAIQASALTTLKEVDVTLNATGTLQIDKWVNWTNGVGNFSGSAYAMTNLANATGTRLIATSGSLNLPKLTTLAGG